MSEHSHGGENSVVADFKRLLADSYTLMLKSQNVHWNLEGPHFHAAHTLTEQHYTELFTAVDEVAEHIRQLGAYAPAGFQDYGRLTQLSDLQASGGEAMLRELAADHERVGQAWNKLASRAGSEGDELSNDLAAARARAHAKAAWMLNAQVR